MKSAYVRPFAPRSPNRQRTAVYVAAFLVAWQLAEAFTHWAFPTLGASPIYPTLALDVLLLLYVGWQWAPLIPLSALLEWAAVDRTLAGLWPALIVQTVVALAFAYAVRLLLRRIGISLPLRTLRDVAWFCGLIGIAAPFVVGTAAVTLLVAIGKIAVEDLPEQLARFVLGDVTSVVSMVPAVITFAGWRQTRPPAEHQDPPLWEIVASVAATAVLVCGGIYLSSLTHEPVLDLSFVVMSWLALRYGIRGAALASITAWACTTVMQILLGLSPDLLVQTQGFLFASSLMVLLLAGLVDERWELVARLSRRAFVDELTGLPNRERLVEWITLHQDSAIVLVILDIDDMRLLNQGVGRVAADHVLQQMAIRLRATFPTSYMIARVSADEFAVAVVDDRSPHAIMTELRAFFDAPFDADGSRVFISVSMGAVRMIRAGSADEMLRKADIALDRAKETPTHAIVYSPELQVGESPSLVGELHRAVERRELVPFYQPIFRYDEATRAWRVAGAEALLRWIHPDRGIVTPANFIDLLERLSIGEHVGWNVMEQALLQAGEWRRDIPDFKVWVNLFARQVLHRHCRDRVRDLLERTAVSADALIVEINEGVIASDEGDVTALVSGLREIGVQCAIDDFGTGGSSLGRVRDVPASVLKIDRSFVTKSEVDTKARAVAVTVMRLASELGMTVVAEGVENTMQLEVMLETGCHYVQGYALGHPLPADLFARTFLTMGRASNL
ncbi:MAG TPA: EAL domain-containing protein [Candidatus Acidoferrales bacterium]|nr:EAL domain-containing protein [Candidatus Acidoferrales bacterium]